MTTMLVENLIAALGQAIDGRRTHERTALQYDRDSILVAGWEEILTSALAGEEITIKTYREQDATPLQPYVLPSTVVTQHSIDTTKYDKLKLSLRYFLLGKEWYRAADALEYFASIHTGTRKSGGPEFSHQIEIAHYLCTLLPGIMYPEDTIIAALGHDAPEDYGIDIAYLTHRFGARPAHAMFLMDKNGKTEDQFFDGMAGDAIASLCKGADRHHNVKTMRGAFKVEKQQRYVGEVRKRYFPMLKTARRNFPQQQSCYENIKHVLTVQVDLLDALNGSLTQES